MADPVDIAIRLAVALVAAVLASLAIGLLLDPNDYPRDRPPPSLAMYATCPTP